MGLVLAAASVLGGLVSGALVTSGHPGVTAAFAAVALPVALWKRPTLGPVVVVVAALTIEQFAYTVGPNAGATTDRIPLFSGLGAGAHVSSADVLLLLLLGIWLLRGDHHQRRWSPSLLGGTIAVLLAAVFLGLVVGVAHRGDLRTAFMEVRPYVYLAVTFLLASALLNTERAIGAVLWAIVLANGFKAAQGILIFLSVRHLDPRPDAVLGHEEAFLFTLSIILAGALWLFDLRGPLRTTATALLPVVFVGDLVNERRTAWLILGASLAVLTVVGFVRLPGRRLLILRFVGTGAVIAAVYLPLYWNNTSALGQPARAIHSLVEPSRRDASSDLYRKQENANLELDIKNAGVMGTGFGVPIGYSLPIANIRDVDPLITYIPHNGVLYVLLRMGLPGGIAFWALLAVGIIGACRLAGSKRRELAVVGMLVACGLIAYVLQGYNDQGFFFYRIAFTMGTLLGLGEAARRLDAGHSVAKAPTTRNAANRVGPR